MTDKTVVIIGAARTPIGSYCGTLSGLSATDLGAIAIKEALQRAHINPGDVDEVILGQSLTGGVGQNPARQTSIKSGIPESVPAFTINQLCGSGIKSIVLGYQSILLGEAKIVVSGGQESMTRTPHCIYLRNPCRMGDATLTDTLLSDGLCCSLNSVHMGVTAENIADRESISRTDQDEYAAMTQKRVEEAQKAGYFDEEIVPVEITTKKGTIKMTMDEHPKHGTTENGLSVLRPAFKKDGTVTPGNASGINDGAAAVVIASLDEAKARGCTPIAKIVGYAQVGVDPSYMGLGPVPAIEKLLEKVRWRKDEVDLFELNEAFAAQALACIRALKLDVSKVNINGGSISLGHPIAASGTRIVMALINNLKRTGGKKGIASLCIGGGMGIALAVEMIN